MAVCRQSAAVEGAEVFVLRLRVGSPPVVPCDDDVSSSVMVPRDDDAAAAVAVTSGNQALDDDGWCGWL